MSVVSSDTARAVLEYAALHGDDQAARCFQVTRETLARYRRAYPDLRLRALSELATHSTEELLTLARGAGPMVQRCAVSTYDGEQYTFAFATDLHVGSTAYEPSWWQSLCAECDRRQVRRLYLAGDITEGMSRRPGHVYELTHIGYDRQRDYAVSELRHFVGEIWMIDGNHDRWHQQAAGALIVQDICMHSEQWHFLGQDEGRHLVNGVEIRLHHGEDGASYARSYRLQKIVEAYSGGEKPRVLLCGHDHKAMHLCAERNVDVFSGGTLQRQTRWMRGKRISAAPGWWMITLVISRAQVQSVESRWYPFYL
jgi:hypothetical protein